MTELTFGYFLYVIGVILLNAIFYALLGSVILIAGASILLGMPVLVRRVRQWITC